MEEIAVVTSIVHLFIHHSQQSQVTVEGIDRKFRFEKLERMFVYLVVMLQNKGLTLPDKLLVPPAKVQKTSN